MLLDLCHVQCELVSRILRRSVTTPMSYLHVLTICKDLAACITPTERQHMRQRFNPPTEVRERRMLQLNPGHAEEVSLRVASTAVMEDGGEEKLRETRYAVAAGSECFPEAWATARSIHPRERWAPLPRMPSIEHERHIVSEKRYARGSLSMWVEWAQGREGPCTLALYFGPGRAVDISLAPDGSPVSLRALAPDYSLSLQWRRDGSSPLVACRWRGRGVTGHDDAPSVAPTLVPFVMPGE
jgi:hypothetical protein